MEKIALPENVQEILKFDEKQLTDFLNNFSLEELVEYAALVTMSLKRSIQYGDYQEQQAAHSKSVLNSIREDVEQLQDLRKEFKQDDVKKLKLPKKKRRNKHTKEKNNGTN